MNATMITISVEHVLGLGVCLVSSALALMWYVHKEVAKAASKEDLEKIKDLSTRNAQQLEHFFDNAKVTDTASGEEVSHRVYEKRNTGRDVFQ